MMLLSGAGWNRLSLATGPRGPALNYSRRPLQAEQRLATTPSLARAEQTGLQAAWAMTCSKVVQGLTPTFTTLATGPTILWRPRHTIRPQSIGSYSDQE